MNGVLTLDAGPPCFSLRYRDGKSRRTKISASLTSTTLSGTCGETRFYVIHQLCKEYWKPFTSAFCSNSRSAVNPTLTVNHVFGTGLSKIPPLPLHSTISTPISSHSRPTYTEHQVSTPFGPWTTMRCDIAPVLRESPERRKPTPHDEVSENTYQPAAD
jgi:hypothetical protein